MVDRVSEQGFWPASDQNWSWFNQSIIAMTHRLTRPVNVQSDNPQSRRVHESRLSRFQGCQLLVLAISLRSAWLHRREPARSRRTRRADAENSASFSGMFTVSSALLRVQY